MSEMISYCGLLCSSCPIYLATNEPDKTKKDDLIGEIINTCKTIYGIDYRYEDINDCDGCKAENGRLFSSCENCKIKKCAGSKKIENCAYCDKYSCNELSEIFKSEPAAKTRLDIIHNNIFIK